MLSHYSDWLKAQHQSAVIGPPEKVGGAKTLSRHSADHEDSVVIHQHKKIQSIEHVVMNLTAKYRPKHYSQGDESTEQ